MEQIRNIFFEYAPWTVFIPWLLALIKLPVLSPALKALFYYLTAAVVTHILAYITWKLKKNNMPILHIYTVVEYLILLRFYYLLLKDFLPTAVFYILAIAFPLFAAADSFLIQNITRCAVKQRVHVSSD